MGRILLLSGDVVGVEFQQKVCKTDDLHTDGGGGEELLDDNVVLFPRDWLGPRDELIPIGRPPERSANGPADHGGPTPTADDFWSEGSAAVQNALRAPEDFAAIEARAIDWSRRRIRALAIGALCAVVLVCVAVFATGGERGRPHAAGRPLASTDTLRAEAGLRGHDARAAVAQPRAPAARPKRRALHQHTRTVVVERVRYVTAPSSTASQAASPTTSASVPSQSTAATSAGSTSSNAQKQPATGADGVLGPGTSPDG